MVIFFVFQLRALRGTIAGRTAPIWQPFGPQLRDEVLLCPFGHYK